MAKAMPPGKKMKPSVFIPPQKLSKNPERVNAPGNGPSTKNATVRRVRNIVGVNQKIVAAGLFSPIVRLGGEWPCFDFEGVLP